MKLLSILFGNRKIHEVNNQLNKLVLAQVELSQAQSRYIASRCSDKQAAKDIMTTADKVSSESDTLKEICESV